MIAVWEVDAAIQNEEGKRKNANWEPFSRCQKVFYFVEHISRLDSFVKISF